MLNITERFGQTSKSVQSPSKTWLYFLVPFNVLTATNVFLALLRSTAVALATWPKAPFPVICFIVTFSLGISQERVYDYEKRTHWFVKRWVDWHLPSIVNKFCQPVPCNGFEKV